MGGREGAPYCSTQEEVGSMPARVADTANAFLGLSRLALVGVSRDAKDFSRGVLRELVSRGYDVVPVNPAAESIEGRRCYARLQEIAPPVEGALVMTPPQAAADAVRDCVAAGVGHVWLHRGAGMGAASPEAIALCRAQGLAAVEGACPYMFLPRASWFHRLHGFFWRRRHARDH
jgi:predicted CoA-binding protein